MNKCQNKSLLHMCTIMKTMKWYLAQCLEQMLPVCLYDWDGIEHNDNGESINNYCKPGRKHFRNLAEGWIWPLDLWRLFRNLLAPELISVARFHLHGLTLIPVWISKYIQVCDEITGPSPNFNGATIGVLEWINNVIPHTTEHAIIYPYWD